MPFGKWESFDSCTKDMMEKEGYDRDTANRVCAQIHYDTTGKWPSEEATGFNAQNHAEVLLQAANAAGKFKASRKEKGMTKRPERTNAQPEDELIIKYIKDLLDGKAEFTEVVSKVGEKYPNVDKEKVLKWISSLQMKEVGSMKKEISSSETPLGTFRTKEFDGKTYYLNRTEDTKGDAERVSEYFEKDKNLTKITESQEGWEVWVEVANKETSASYKEFWKEEQLIEAWEKAFEGEKINMLTDSGSNIAFALTKKFGDLPKAVRERLKEEFIKSKETSARAMTAKCEYCGEMISGEDLYEAIKEHMKEKHPKIAKALEEKLKKDFFGSKQKAARATPPSVGDKIKIKKGLLSSIDIPEGMLGRTGTIQKVAESMEGYKFTVEMDDGSTLIVDWGHLEKAEKADGKKPYEQKTDYKVGDSVTALIKDKSGNSVEVNGKIVDKDTRGLRNDWVVELKDGRRVSVGNNHMIPQEKAEKLETEEKLEEETSTKVVEDLTQAEYDEIYESAKRGFENGESKDMVSRSLVEAFDIDKESADDIIDSVPFWDNISEKSSKRGRGSWEDLSEEDKEAKTCSKCGAVFTDDEDRSRMIFDGKPVCGYCYDELIVEREREEETSKKETAETEEEKLERLDELSYKMFDEEFELLSDSQKGRVMDEFGEVPSTIEKSTTGKEFYTINDILAAGFNLEPTICRNCGYTDAFFNQGISCVVCENCGLSDDGGSVKQQCEEEGIKYQGVAENASKQKATDDPDFESLVRTHEGVEYTLTREDDGHWWASVKWPDGTSDDKKGLSEEEVETWVVSEIDKFAGGWQELSTVPEDTETEKEGIQKLKHAYENAQTHANTIQRRRDGVWCLYGDEGEKVIENEDVEEVKREAETRGIEYNLIE